LFCPDRLGTRLAGGLPLRRCVRGALGGVSRRLESGTTAALAALIFLGGNLASYEHAKSSGSQPAAATPNAGQTGFLQPPPGNDLAIELD